MQIAFLHTLAANQTLFESFIAPSGLDRLASIVHHSAPQLLQYASAVGLDDELASMVEQQIVQLEAQGADWIVCTCSSIGALAEQAKTRFAQVMRVDRPMAIEASQSGHIKVLAALATTINPTINLLAEYDADIAQRSTVEVIPEAWAHYLAGDNDAYLATIAQYITQHCQDDGCIVLAQASMAPAILQLDQATRQRALTSPSLCLDYLLAELEHNNNGDSQ
ncbi:hypothetical protein VII00023_05467 [Vibrio ichthyoenteri ATCC 700023]|uniref:Uncharacterized protein n=1 Tax=Vibrio ichthyoenteri ATCC 700023 TaxID=870968 RepID=F9S720_9VIBR|nr:hypothetical protein [Vibrio ichthyoenteri]EGU32086.1 hypothetical protein VII00023_05467 [Vibrio ichthyoenteri ATCC 700023]